MDLPPLPPPPPDPPDVRLLLDVANRLERSGQGHEATPLRRLADRLRRDERAIRPDVAPAVDPEARPIVAEASTDA